MKLHRKKIAEAKFHEKLPQVKNKKASIIEASLMLLMVETKKLKEKSDRETYPAPRIQIYTHHHEGQTSTH